MTRILALALVLFTVPAAFAAGFWYSATSESDSVRGASETKVFRHTLSERAEGTELRVKLRLREGEAVVTLLDPAGKARFRKTFAKGKSTVEETFGRLNGEWRVQLELARATGSYSVSLVDY